MENVIQFMQSLFDDMDDIHWHIVGMADYEEVEEDGLFYAKVKDYGEYEKQDKIYIQQTTGYSGDDYSGTIIKPITDSKALVVQFSC
ncbi:hypothetical protein [Shouchella hunanensis]|uniref:Uncharacterized protein n=1 Tax=Shouchella hunanensis TaxID=766894 RepID=A0ABY7W2W1_9BACI|nr:hypothetical protein [Shouchella hunanensis]WDF02916.1 hypothetical protein PQ477_15625 [Shouchella hunanensis]